MKKTLCILVLLSFSVNLFAQGSLTPPGAPGATMKTLDQLDSAISGVSDTVSHIQGDSRTDVTTLSGTNSYLYSIDEPGSYYLTEDISVDAFYGILIDSDNVALDLNGYTIRKNVSSGIGIDVASGVTDVSIRNGFISGFLFGVRANQATNVYIEDMVITKPSSAGIQLIGDNNHVSRCRISQSYYGVDAQNKCTITDSIVSQNHIGINADDECVIQNCVASTNGFAGIFTGAKSSLINCVANNNQGAYGIRSGEGSTLKNCIALGNIGPGSASYGIYVGHNSMVIECTAKGNSNTNSLSTAAQGLGIHISSGIIKNCTSTGNQGTGIRVYDNSFVTGNNSYGNGTSGDGAGIHVDGSDNRIDGNTVTDNDRGIDVDISGNLIVRNSASGNTANYDIIAGNDTGTITNSPVGAGAWDNFEF